MEIDRDALLKALTENAGLGADTAAQFVAQFMREQQPREDGMVIKAYAADEIRATKDGDIEAYISTEAVDRVGDSIPSKAWEVANYRKTGSPVLAFHEYGLVGGQVPVVGNAMKVERDKTGLLAVTRFHGKTQLSRDLEALYRDGHMRSFSVGFRSLQPPDVLKDDNDRFTGYKFTKVELLEYSVVAVPANPEAVVRAFRAKAISEGTASFIASHSPAGGQYGGGADDKVANAVNDIIRQHTVLRTLMR